MSPFDRLPDELLSHILDSYRSPLSGYWDCAFFECFTVSRRWERLARALLYRGVVRVESEEDCARLQDLPGEKVKRVKRLVVAGDWEGEEGAAVFPYEVLEAVARRLQQLDAVELRIKSESVGIMPVVPFCSLSRLARLYLGSDMAYDLVLTSARWTFASLVVLVVNAPTAVEVGELTPARLPSLKAAYFAEIFAAELSFDYLGFDRALLEQLDTLQLLYSPDAEDSQIGACTYLQLEHSATQALDPDVTYIYPTSTCVEHGEATANCVVDLVYPGIRHLRSSMHVGGELSRLEATELKLAQFPNLATISVPLYFEDLAPSALAGIEEVCAARGITLLRNSVSDRSDLDYEFWEWAKEERRKSKF